MEINVREVLIVGVVVSTIFIALSKFVKATKIELDKNTDSAYYNVGLRALESGDYGKAIVAIKSAIKINCQPYFYWQQLGIAYEKKGEHSAAIRAYQKAISKYTFLDTNKLKMYVELGSLYNKKSNYRQAINCFKSAISIDNNNSLINCQKIEIKSLESEREVLKINKNTSKIVKETNSKNKSDRAKHET